MTAQKIEKAKQWFGEECKIEFENLRKKRQSKLKTNSEMNIQEYKTVRK